jgi:hypothetical protein
MVIPRHRFAVLLELCRLGAASEAARMANRDALETVLVGLYSGASDSARKAFLVQMDPVPKTEKPWAAVLPKVANTAPAVVTLLYGQVDDDPDAAEDGDRLPDRGTPLGAPWAPLFTAIDRWDLPAIATFIGPLGWELPISRPMPLDEGIPAEHAPAKVPNPGPAPPLPPLPAPAPTPTAAVSFWRRPAALVASGVGGTVLVGLVIRGLTRSAASSPEVKA